MVNLQEAFEVERAEYFMQYIVVDAEGPFPKSVHLRKGTSFEKKDSI
jgi:hypothetical protein